MGVSLSATPMLAYTTAYSASIERPILRTCDANFTVLQPVTHCLLRTFVWFLLLEANSRRQNDQVCSSCLSGAWRSVEKARRYVFPLPRVVYVSTSLAKYLASPRWCLVASKQSVTSSGTPLLYLHTLYPSWPRKQSMIFPHHI